jgi:hypothetical protein
MKHIIVTQDFDFNCHNILDNEVVVNLYVFESTMDMDMDMDIDMDMKIFFASVFTAANPTQLKVLIMYVQQQYKYECHERISVAKPVSRRL